MIEKMRLRPASLILALLLLSGTAQGDFATFIAGNTPAIPPHRQGEADDPDEDGVPSVIEYLVDGMNPGIPDAHVMPAAVAGGGVLTYSISKRAGIDGLTTAFEVFTEASGQWQVSTNVTEDSATLVLSEPVAAGAVLARLNVTGGPVLPPSNPIAQAYPEEYLSGEYAWTDQINWNDEFDVTAYGAVADGNYEFSFGTDNLAAFNAAMAAAAANGGGTVRIPAGVYYIGDHLLIPPGVVLRGADLPEGEDSGSGNTLNPPSKLVFPKYLPALSGSGSPSTVYKKIYSDALARLDDSDTGPVDFAAHGRIGLVNLDINRAAIILDTPDANPIRTGAAYSGVQDSVRLPPFLTPGGVGQYFVLYGVRSNNAACSLGAEGVRLAEPPRVEQFGWQRTPYFFNANIRILSGGYTIVANCRINDLSAANTWSWGVASDPEPVYYDDSYDQPGYIARGNNGSFYALNNPGMATFRHSHQYGLSLNGLFCFAKAGKGGAPADSWGNPNGWYGSPTSAPWLFRPGHVVRDNFVYSTQGAKMESSGSGLVVKDNIFRDAPDKVNFYRQNGWQNLSGSAYLQRGLLQGGQDIVVTNNEITTYKSTNGDAATGLPTAISTNDNEGLMIDNTSTNIWNWHVENNVTTSSIFGFDVKGTEGVTMRGNLARQILITTSVGRPYRDILVENNTGIGWNWRLVGDPANASNNICRNNTGAMQLLITLAAFDDVSGNTGFSAIVDTLP